MLNRTPKVILFNSKFNSTTLCISYLRIFCVTMVKPCNTLAELDEEILAAGDKLVVVHIFRRISCWMVDDVPGVDKLATEEKDVAFLQVNVVVNTEADERFNINALPKFILIKDGAIIDEVLGCKLDKLKEVINEHRGSQSSLSAWWPW